jgi:hypothetical protein
MSNHQSLFRADRFVTPLYSVRPCSTPDSGGSGTWLQVGGEKFLVTAAHVIDHGYTWIPMERGFKKLVSPCYMTVPPSGLRSSDRCDIGIYHLLAEDIEAKHPFHEFIKTSDIDVDLLHQAGEQFEFFGYPYRKQQFDRTTRKVIPFFMSILSDTVDKKIVEKVGLSIYSHVVIAFRREKMVSNGRFITAPLPAGMSGGAVWKKTTGRDDRKLAAIAIEHSEDCLIGTRIAIVLEFIRALLPALSTYIPKPSDTKITASVNVAQ